LDRFLTTLGANPREWTLGDRRITIFAIVIVLAIIITAVSGYAFGWEWIGLTKPKQRTFWDWLDLLIVPVVLALGGYLFNRSENRRTQKIATQQRTADQEIADQRLKADREIAAQRRQDDTLQAYLDQIGQLLLDKDRPLRKSEVGDEVRTLARARTLTVLARLDKDRKESVVQFLLESGLLAKPSKVNLNGADLSGIVAHWASLSGADLSGSSLSGADLSGLGMYEHNVTDLDLSTANLRGANLSRTWLLRPNLWEADLSGANLYDSELIDANLNGTDLSSANLVQANLSNAQLEEASPDAAAFIPTKLCDADLSRANLSYADLSGAQLNGADLSGTNLSGAIVPEWLLAVCKSLEGAIMPDGQKYEDWLKTPEGKMWLAAVGGEGENSGPS
jgi:uncharacterized protein YjbI with pentapeptide repeats